MKRLIQAVALAAVATGVTYVALYLTDARHTGRVRSVPREEVDEDGFTARERALLLRELSGLL